MHTEIEIIVDPSYTVELIQDLQRLQGVISLSIVREASIKPPSDVFTVHALNCEVDEVLKLAETARKHGQVFSLDIRIVEHDRSRTRTEGC